MPSKKNLLLDHADEADGIQEYDNNLPTWWVGIFVLSCVWAFGYVVWLQLATDWSQSSSYNNEVEAALEMWPPPDPSTLLVADAEAVEAGRAIYATNCIACHGAKMEGGIGLNLADSEWKYGGDLAGIRDTVTNGVASAGMPSWGPILGPVKVAQVAAFVHQEGGGI